MVLGTVQRCRAVQIMLYYSCLFKYLNVKRRITKRSSESKHPGHLVSRRFKSWSSRFRQWTLTTNHRNANPRSTDHPAGLTAFCNGSAARNCCPKYRATCTNISTAGCNNTDCAKPGGCISSMSSPSSGLLL